MSEPRVRLNPLRPEPTARPSRRAGLILWLIAAAGLIVSGFPSQWLLAGRDEMDVQLRLLIANLIYYLPFVALPLMLCVRRRPGISASLRPNPISLFSTISIAAMALLGVFLVNDLTVLWAIPLQELGLNVSGTSLPVPGDTRGLALLVFTAAVLPAVCEEFLFRGALLASLEEGGSRHAALASALLFMLLHGSVVGMPTQFLLGVVLAALVIYCDSIYAGLIYHTVHNAATVFLQYLQQSVSEPVSAAPVRYLEAIGGAKGVVTLAVEILLTGAMMLFTLRVFRMRARLNGVCSQPRNKRPLKVTEWLPLIGGCALAALLYASDILVMLGR